MHLVRVFAEENQETHFNVLKGTYVLLFKFQVFVTLTDTAEMSGKLGDIVVCSV